MFRLLTRSKKPPATRGVTGGFCLYKYLPHQAAVMPVGADITYSVYRQYGGVSQPAGILTACVATCLPSAPCAVTTQNTGPDSTGGEGNGTPDQQRDKNARTIRKTDVA